MDDDQQDILVEEDLWERNEGSPVPDKPKIVTILGSSLEDSLLVRDGVPERRTKHFARQIQTWFEEQRRSGIPMTEESIPLDKGYIDREEERKMVAPLRDWLEEVIIL